MNGPISRYLTLLAATLLAACGGSDDGDDTGSKLSACEAIVECYRACDGDTCAKACDDDAAAEAVAAYAALQTCGWLDSECGNMEPACLAQHCADELAACAG